MNKTQELTWDYTGTVGNLDLILPQAFDEHDDYIYLGRNRFVRVYGVLALPFLVHIGYFDPLYVELGQNIDTIDYIERIPDQEAVNKLTTEITKAQSNASLNGGDEKYTQKANDYRKMRKDIQLGRKKLLSVTKLIRVWGKTLEELNENSDIFENQCETMSIIVHCLSLKQAEAFKSTMPSILMTEQEKKYKNNITSDGFAALLPDGTNGLQHPEGYYLGYTLATKTRIFYDNFVGPPLLSNPMIMIIAPSGSGKSVLLKTITSRSTSNGAWNVYFDIEGEAEKLIKYLGGNYIEIEAGSKTGINPLDLEVEEDKKGNRKIDIYGKVAEIREMLSIFCEKMRGHGLRGLELTGVEEAVRELYSDKKITQNPDSLYEYRDDEGDEFSIGQKKKKMPILSDLRNKLDEYPATKKLAELMKLITGDGSMALFDCQTTVKLQQGLTGIGFKGVSDGFMKFYAVINAIEWVWSVFGNYKYKHIKKNVEIDEGWYFAKYPAAAALLEEMDRRGRKYTASLIIASQFINEFLASESGQTIIDMASTKIIMKQNPDSVDKVAGHFKLSNSLKNDLVTFEEGNALLLCGNNKVKMHVEVFDFEWEYFRT
ncbi:ATP-binding protein (plasmid) [Vallitalea pronyensis]|uniref:ATP-binding protein n=1 Tax=Vallitalea pronyensis TaxID=1348613 RepID=A0A8J8SJT1_9FIRM|nr:ATP-binding protein [Vallitalea pronyensis]QUI25903.1 ATP-binding protein [Vallitalea pronyensis]